MGVKNKKAPKPKGKLSRKELRKEKRKDKKIRRNEYYTNRKKLGQLVMNPDKNLSNSEGKIANNNKKRSKASESIEKTGNKVLTTEELRRKEQKEQKNIQKQMNQQRKKQLAEANLEEDRNIKQLEKQLKLNKRKTKGVPKSFASDGLDFLLEVCDSEAMKNAVVAEKELMDANDDFEEDFALMTGKTADKSSKKTSISEEYSDEDQSDLENFLNEDDGSEEEDFDEMGSMEEDFDDNDDDDADMESESEEEISKYNKPITGKKAKKDKDHSDEDIDSDEDLPKTKKKSLKNNEERTKKTKSKAKKNSKKTNVREDISDEDLVSEDEDHSDEDIDSDEDLPKTKKKSLKNNEERTKKTKSKAKKNSKKTNVREDISDEDLVSEDEEKQTKISKKSKQKQRKRSLSENSVESIEESKTNKKQKLNDDDSEDFEDEMEEGSDNDEFSEEEKTKNKSASKVNPDGTWEDIYGRLRGKDGSIITKSEGKYIPPAIRAKMEAGSSEDKKRLEKLNRLIKQIKGLLNRLAESNMHSIATQIEELYMNNSRNDMNDTLTSLIIDSLVSNVIAPERLLMEHVLLVTVLHANIGTEIGAHFLQTVIKKFDEYYKAYHSVENKMLDNIVNIIAQLYNFKLFDSKLVYEVLDKLSEKFEEKDVECILHILKAIGFGLRKDDPLALKNLIVNLQKQAANASEELKDNPRVKFMLDVLLAIKNNNVTKIPNYDTSYSEHLKKIMKGFIRKGNYVTQLNITLEDLLKADERGRWWVVGSAWTGNITETNEKNQEVKSDGFSQKLLELARKQRMNTDTRRNIFCIIMTAEDYLDAFEKLLKLGLKNQQEREIIHVILHCCLHEKNYNAYYSVLAQKFCEYDRKYQMTIKYSVWDKLKSLNDHSGSQISNLAKLLTHLFVEKGLPISTLKIVQFSELDKVTLRFMRQILLGILLHNDLEAVQGVFEKVAHSDKLKMFRESLRLFIHHFLLRNLKTDSVPEDQKELLESRAKMVENVLVSREGKLRF